MDDQLTFRTTKSADKPLNELAQLAESATNPGTQVSKGQMLKVVGAIRFEKKENGWWVDSVRMASITPGERSAASPGQVSHKPAVATTPLPKTIPEAPPAALPEEVSTGVAQELAKAEAGDASSQLGVGQLYELGQEKLPKDDVKAAKWYAKAAAQNNPAAQTLLAALYEGGRGVPKNQATAIQLYQKAAAAGYPPAMSRLSELDESPTGQCVKNLKQIGFALSS